MKKLLVAGLAAGLVASAAPAARAHPGYHYVGTCLLAVANDMTPGAQFGGPTRWTGVGAFAGVATTANGVPGPTLPMSAGCNLYINGVFVMSLANPSGFGVLASAQTVSFSANLNDYVLVCEVVTVNGDQHTLCKQVVLRRSVPQAVSDAVDAVLYTAYPIVDPVKHVVDALLCPVLALVPDVPPVTFTNQGDVHVYGDQVYDCPAYGIGYPSPNTYVGHVMTWPF